MMRDHGKSGRTFSGRVVQLVTGSTGLDDFEWGVTLFAKSPDVIKDVVYTMRFDKGSALYGEFGAVLRRLSRLHRQHPLTPGRGADVRRRRPSTNSSLPSSSKVNTSKRPRGRVAASAADLGQPGRAVVVDLQSRRAQRVDTLGVACGTATAAADHGHRTRRCRAPTSDCARLGGECDRA